ncbi:MAG TPA: ferredoxin [Propionibacteriaceae bacterium]|nr:ferredoxin [Propionibacteriaceae bacterium]
MSPLARLLAARRRPTGQRLRVDPLACEGVGQCAMAASRLVDLDRWGYPVLPKAELEQSQLPAAERAVRACPRNALWLEETA